MVKKSEKTDKKLEELEAQVAELTADLQRVRADFENYRKRVEAEKSAARDSGAMSAIMKLLPVVDTIELAVQHVPADLADHQWVRGIAAMQKNLDKALDGLSLRKIDVKEGDAFDPDRHDAVQCDEDAEGDREVIATVLQPGYMYGDKPLRHAMVRVTRVASDESAAE